MLCEQRCRKCTDYRCTIHHIGHGVYFILFIYLFTPPFTALSLFFFFLNTSLWIKHKCHKVLRCVTKPSAILCPRENTSILEYYKDFCLSPRTGTRASSLSIFKTLFLGALQIRCPMRPPPMGSLIGSFLSAGGRMSGGPFLKVRFPAW